MSIAAEDISHPRFARMYPKMAARADRRGAFAASALEPSVPHILGTARRA